MESRRDGLHPKKYKANAFHHQFGGGKSSGEIQIIGQKLIFSADTGVVELPLRGLQIRRGGASNRLLFFAHSDEPEASVYTADISILDDANLNDSPDIAKQISQLRQQRKHSKLAVAGVALLFIGLVYGLFSLKEPIVSRIATQVPPQWEHQLGETVYAQLTRGRLVIENQAVVDELNQLIAPLVDAIEDERYEFRFHILVDDTLNAFAIPGGHVVLHTGLILAADTPEEVVGVLAHEIAHVTQQHSIRQIIQSAGVVLVVQSLLGDVSGILALITQRSAFLLTRKFSRDYETDADEKGWGYLVKANISPQGMIAFFEKLQADAEKSGRGQLEKSLNFLSTHPTTQERINRLNEKWQQEKNSRFVPYELDFNAFQEKIRHHRHKKEEETVEK